VLFSSFAIITILVGTVQVAGLETLLKNEKFLVRVMSLQHMYE